MPTIAIADKQNQAHVPTKHEIETFSGRYVDLSNPSADTITLEDIAHGLAHTCRYNGQIAFYSVAEHAVKVARYLGAVYGRERAFKGLHHDDAEAYLGDVTRPLKSLLQPVYGELSDAMDLAIIEALGLPWDGDALHDPEVKAADNLLLMIEAKHLLPSEGKNWGGLENAWDLSDVANATDLYVQGLAPECLSPDQAEAAYLSMHWELVR